MQTVLYFITLLKFRYVPLIAWIEPSRKLYDLIMFASVHFEKSSEGLLLIESVTTLLSCKVNYSFLVP